jgi:hypothetical protein
MMLRERFILAYAIIALGTAVVFGFIGLFELRVHFTVYMFELLVILVFFEPHRRSFSRVLRPVITATFLGFLYVVASGVIQTLTAH